MKWRLGKRYTTYGVREYWAVDPANRTMDVWASMESPPDKRQVVSAGGTLVAAVLPGLELPLAEIFAGVDEIPVE